MISKTPVPPYYAVIFTSLRTEGDHGYAAAAEQMIKLAEKQAGFLGVEHAREVLGITVSYWKDLESITTWRNHADHTLARQKGRAEWYKEFQVRIARVERAYGFSAETDHRHMQG
jgi:heme-degrading monooxygenase HmoA